MNKTLHKMICLAGMLMAWGSMWADIASGTSGNCTWKIDDNGKLTVSPNPGTDGMMGTWSSNYPGEGVPWSGNRKDITSAEILAGVKLQTCGFLFYGCPKLSSFSIDYNSTENVTELTSMFASCGLKTITKEQLNFNTTNVEIMTSMFNGCSALTSIDLSNLITSNVTSTALMFHSCTSLTSLTWNCSKPTNLVYMKEMFRNCYRLESLNLSNFDFSSVTDFESAMHLDGSNATSSLTSIYLPDNAACKDKYNEFLKTRTYGDYQHPTYPAKGSVCAIYITSKSKYDDMEVLGSNYPFNIDPSTKEQQYILAGDICDTYTSVDPGNTAHTFAAGEIRYIRNIKSNYGTVVLPWKIAPKSGSYTLYKAKNISNQNLFITEVLSSVEANTPCVFIAENTGNLIIYNAEAFKATTNVLPTTSSDLLPASGTGTIDVNSNLKFIGKYSSLNKKSAASDDYYYYYYENNRFLRATGTLTVPIFRAYLAVSKKSSSAKTASAKALNIVIDDEIGGNEASGIEATTVEPTYSESIYTISGVKVNGKPQQHGIYIVNGKKQIF